MNRRFLWKLSVSTTPEAEERVADLLTESFGQSASVFNDLSHGKIMASVYLETKPDWSKAARKRLTQTLEQIRAFDATAAHSRVTLARLEREDWAESWKRHFKPLKIGAKLLIKPSWSRRRARHGQLEVVLDPGMSFGTGQHPTTGFCLQELVRHRRAGQEQSLLDVGTGSGILAICAARLGYQPIEAIDLDAEAIRVSRANARLNKVSALIRFRLKDLSALSTHGPNQHSVICANLISTLLQAQRDRLLARLQQDGLLVLAGILNSEFHEIRAAYEAAGLRMLRSRTEREWHSGSFTW